MIATMLLISGCSYFEEEEPIVNTTTITEEPGKPKNLSLCELELFNIARVNNINTNSCITKSNKDNTSIEAELLRGSLLMVGKKDSEIALLKMNATCGEIDYLGQAYCLDDNSSCIITNNNHCVIVQLTAPVNQTNITQ